MLQGCYKKISNQIKYFPKREKKYLRLNNSEFEYFLDHLIKRFEIHQKFETLSSNNPRATGNIRWMACKISSFDRKNGKKHKEKVIMTVKAKEMIVRIFDFNVGWENEYLNK